MRDPSSKICNKDNSKRAAQMFWKLGNWEVGSLDDVDSCSIPCQQMKVITLEKTPVKISGNETYFSLRFTREIEVVVEVLDYTFLNLLAEVGGYLGLFLGVSLLQIKHIITRAKQIMKK